MDKKWWVLVVVLLLVLVTWRYSGSLTGSAVLEEVDLERGLVASYPFAENDGKAEAVEGSGLDVQTVSGALWMERTGGRGFRFDGINDYLDVGTSELFELRDFTLSAWIRPDTDDLRLVVYRGPGGTVGHVNYQLMASQSQVQLGYGTGSLVRSVQADLKETLGEYLVAASFTTVSREMVLYVDGLEVARSSVEGLPYLENGSHFLIGSGDSIWGQGVQPILNFDGSIDDVTVYRRALSPKEVAVLHGKPASAALIPPDDEGNESAQNDSDEEGSDGDDDEESDGDDGFGVDDEVDGDSDEKGLGGAVWFVLGLLAGVVLFVLLRRRSVHD